MSNRGRMASALSILLALASGSPGAEGPPRPGDPPKKILLELSTSPGSRMGPLASDLLGRLARLGYGPDRVVALTFRLDDPDSGRGTLGRFGPGAPPLMIVDGRAPLSGPDEASALAALGRAGREPAGASLELALAGDGLHRSLSVRVAGRSPAVDGRELVVGVALAEDPVTTRITSGRDAGRTLVDHQVVRRFASKVIRLDGSRSRTLTFPVELVDMTRAGRTRVAVFVQDRLDGIVYQAESIPWPAAAPHRELAHRKAKPRPRAPLPTFDLFAPPSLATWVADPPPCPDCGMPLAPEYLNALPPGVTLSNRIHFPNLPPPPC